MHLLVEYAENELKQVCVEKAKRDYQTGQAEEKTRNEHLWTFYDKFKK